jgi:chemotaxis protein histidine kinase CheA
MSFDDMMKSLKINYLKDLESRINSLPEFHGKIEEKHEEIRTFFHQLKGSGATYGVPKISEIGKNYEEKIKSKTFSNEDLSASKSELEEVLKSHL